MDDRLIRDIIHIFGHLFINSLILWQVILGIWLLLKWVNKNWKFVKSPTNTEHLINPVINIDGTNINKNGNKVKKDMGVVDVDYKKNVFISDVDNKSVKLDEKITGKVKTQKDKLKKLKGK